MGSKFGEDIVTTYLKLGGLLDIPPINFYPWDISTKDFVIELDEEAHFNRYRQISLHSKYYEKLAGLDVQSYSRYCIDRETEWVDAARRGIEYWTKVSADRQFGRSGERYNLEGAGSSRWRQRAFYDYLKDVYSQVVKLPVIRISIYDQYEGISVDTLLKKQQEQQIIELVRMRVSQVLLS